MSDSGKGKIDIPQLIKILNLTQSDSDGEALNALRMANSKLKAAGVTWDQLLKSVPSQPKKVYKYKEAPENFNSGFFRNAVKTREFTDMLDKSQKKWINDIIEYYNENYDLPHKVWTSFRTLWYNFREAYHQRNN